jgi:hypothetical protein
MPETTVANTLRRPRAARKTAAGPAPTSSATIETESDIDTSYLESLLGYNARRAALAVIGVFLQRMAPYGLRPVDFSVLTLIAHNPGITSRQLCAALDILPPNLVGMIKSLDKRGLIERRAHPTDRPDGRLDRWPCWWSAGCSRSVRAGCSWPAARARWPRWPVTARGSSPPRPSSSGTPDTR